MQQQAKAQEGHRDEVTVDEFSEVPTQQQDHRLDISKRSGFVDIILEDTLMDGSQPYPEATLHGGEARPDHSNRNIYGTYQGATLLSLFPPSAFEDDVDSGGSASTNDSMSVAYGSSPDSIGATSAKSKNPQRVSASRRRAQQAARRHLRSYRTGNQHAEAGMHPSQYDVGWQQPPLFHANYHVGYEAIVDESQQSHPVVGGQLPSQRTEPSSQPAYASEIQEADEDLVSFPHVEVYGQHLDRINENDVCPKGA